MARLKMHCCRSSVGRELRRGEVKARSTPDAAARRASRSSLSAAPPEMAMMSCFGAFVSSGLTNSGDVGLPNWLT